MLDISSVIANDEMLRILAGGLGFLIFLAVVGAFTAHSN